MDERRLNIGERLLSILVTNNTSTPLTISAAALTTPLYSETSHWSPGPTGSSTLNPAATVALPVPLPAARCDQRPSTAPQMTPAPGATAAPGPIPNPPPEAATALLTVDGLQREIEASDPYSVLTRFHQQDCLERAVQEVAVLDLSSALTVAPDGRTAVVHLTVAPTGGSGTVLLEGFGNTTLLTENPQQPWPRDISISGDGSQTTLDLAVVPARCDPHALAEDKTGTKLPVNVSTADRSGQLRLEPSTEFTRSVYAFVAGACGN